MCIVRVRERVREMPYTADVCERCLKTVIKRNEEDSSDVVTRRGEFVFLCDTIGKRPMLTFDGEKFCLECFVEMIKEWTGKKMKVRRVRKGGEEKWESM